MLEKKKILRVRKSERSESAVNLKFEFENIPLTIQLINVRRLCSRIATESRKSSVRYFQSFVLNQAHHQIFSNVSKAKPLPLCNRCLFHITSCKRSFTFAFKCVITSVPIAEQQLFYERSARVSSLISFSHSGSVRSSFGIRRIVIPRLHKNQNAWTSPVPIPTKIRQRGLMARKTRAQHKVIL